QDRQPAPVRDRGMGLRRLHLRVDHHRRRVPQLPLPAGHLGQRPPAARVPVPGREDLPGARLRDLARHQRPRPGSGRHPRDGDRPGVRRAVSGPVVAGGCLICELERAAPGAVVFRDELWAAEVAPGYEVPGWFFLRVRRHAELLTGLDDAELAAFGRRARDLVAAVTEATGAPATYLLHFGENYRHFHALVAARGADIPAERRGGNILGLRPGHVDVAAAVALVPDVRAAYERAVAGGLARGHA